MSVHIPPPDAGRPVQVDHIQKNNVVALLARTRGKRDNKDLRFEIKTFAYKNSPGFQKTDWDAFSERCDQASGKDKLQDCHKYEQVVLPSPSDEEHWGKLRGTLDDTDVWLLLKWKQSDRVVGGTHLKFLTDEHNHRICHMQAFWLADELEHDNIDASATGRSYKEMIHHVACLWAQQAGAVKLAFHATDGLHHSHHALADALGYEYSEHYDREGKFVRDAGQTARVSRIGGVHALIQRIPDQSGKLAPRRDMQTGARMPAPPPFMGGSSSFR